MAGAIAGQSGPVVARDPFGRLGEDETMTVRFRREEGAAPPGETGDYGQHSPLPEGALVRLCVTYDGEGRAQLLEPDGREPAE